MKKSCFLLFLVLAGCKASKTEAAAAVPASKPPAQSDSASTPAPDFDLAKLSGGGKINSSKLKGKIVIIDFWATWCVACKEDTPVLNEIYEKYKDKGVDLIGVAVQSGTAKEVKAKARELGMKYPIAMGDDKIEAGFGGFPGLPMTYVVRPDWTFRHIYPGATPFKKPMMEKELDELLGNTPKPTD